MKKNIPLAIVWLWDDYSQLGASAIHLVTYLPSHIQHALVEW